MNNLEIFEEAVSVLIEFGQVCLNCESGEQYVIDPAENYGGEEGFYMCGCLGSVMYDSEESVVSELIKYIDDTETIEEITID